MRRAASRIAPAVLTLLAACRPGPDTPGHGPHLYAASGFTDQVVVVDPFDGTVLRTVGVANRPYSVDEPHGIAVSPDGSRWYVTLAHGEPMLRVFERPGDRQVGALILPMAGASRIGLTPDGEVAFVPDYWRSALDAPGRVARIRTQTLEVTHAPEVCRAPHDARVDPSGRRVLVTCAYGDEIVLLDAEDMRVVARVSLSPPPGGAPPHPHEATEMIPEGIEAMPMNAAWAPDGETAWVTLMAADRVVGIDREGGIVAWGATGRHPASAAPTPDGRRLLVTNRGERSLSILRLPDLGEERRVELDGAHHPQGLALDGEGLTAFVGYEGRVGELGGLVAVRIEDGTVLWRTEVGTYLLGVAWAPPYP